LLNQDRNGHRALPIELARAEPCLDSTPPAEVSSPVFVLARKCLTRSKQLYTIGGLAALSLRAHAVASGRPTSNVGYA
jgi:hypothetical protein